MRKIHRNYGYDLYVALQTTMPLTCLPCHAQKIQYCHGLVAIWLAVCWKKWQRWQYYSMKLYLPYVLPATV